MTNFDEKDGIEKLKDLLREYKAEGYIVLEAPEEEQDNVDLISLKNRVEELKTKIEGLIYKKQKKEEPVYQPQSQSVDQEINPILKRFGDDIKEWVKNEVLNTAHAKCLQFTNEQVTEINRILKLMIDELNRHYATSMIDRIKDRPNLDATNLKLRYIQ